MSSGSDFCTAPEAIEVPPEDYDEHRCAVSNPPMGTDCWWGDYEKWGEYWRPPGTLWRCPSCWRWWVAKRLSSKYRWVRWHKVRPLTSSWFRARRVARELR